MRQVRFIIAPAQIPAWTHTASDPAIFPGRSIAIVWAIAGSFNGTSRPGSIPFVVTR